MDEKQQLRNVVRAARLTRAHSQADSGSAADAALTENLAAVATKFGATRVACFIGVRGEPDTAAFLAWALAANIEVLLPRSRADGALEWATYVPDGLAPGAFGIPEPQGPPVPDGAATAGVLFVPAAAVDETGGRLGWGRGFYDRELTRIRAARTRPPSVFAVVWESEVLPAVPREHHDVPVDGAVTEATVHYFG
ncbi:5-formyltetrahydrofolate cyclo-ligase [Leucobacter sp. NPDC015123]|uniref:5-formyltetrahydrofolate cyclo-ligase n=1 Tax=Leucobacter sp. NPDC015123 TaxID=3364129 RepID=UPI0036F49EB7